MRARLHLRRATSTRLEHARRVDNVHVHRRGITPGLPAVQVFGALADVQRERENLVNSGCVLTSRLNAGRCNLPKKMRERAEKSHLRSR
jgi:hypothetical protein